MTDSTPLVQCRGLVRTFREGEVARRVLDGASLAIERGEVVALLGRSGSGKSTLLNLLSGIDLPDAGEISIDGVDMVALTERQRTLFRRDHLGFVFQFFNLVPTLTVAENLLLPLELKGEKDRRPAAAEWLERIGLGDRGASFPDRLSGGERQRLAVARALVHHPLLVLADEPTGNLDQETGDRVLDLLLELTRDRGRTLLIVTHSRAVARRADRTLSLADGRLTAS
ncbi:MAG: ABC transporter ATP-binding protein [Acidobacteriota bacterium]